MTADRESRPNLFSRAEWSTLQQSLGLSKRQVQVTQHLVDDHKKARIAMELKLSEHTVNNYIRIVYAKLGVRSRCELVVRLLVEHRAICRHQIAGGP